MLGTVLALVLQVGWCLPAEVPALESLRPLQSVRVQIPSVTPGVRHAARETLYVDDTGREWAIVVLMRWAAVVDDQPREPTATLWLLDPGLVTDDVPPRVQADPKPTCQWRRRANT